MKSFHLLHAAMYHLKNKFSRFDIREIPLTTETQLLRSAFNLGKILVILGLIGCLFSCSQNDADTPVLSVGNSFFSYETLHTCDIGGCCAASVLTMSFGTNQ